MTLEIHTVEDWDRHTYMTGLNRLMYPSLAFLQEKVLDFGSKKN